MQTYRNSRAADTNLHTVQPALYCYKHAITTCDCGQLLEHECTLEDRQGGRRAHSTHSHTQSATPVAPPAQLSTITMLRHRRKQGTLA